MTETQNFELSNDIVIEDLVKHEALVKEMKERIDSRNEKTYNLKFVFAK